MREDTDFIKSRMSKIPNTNKLVQEVREAAVRLIHRPPHYFTTNNQALDSHNLHTVQHMTLTVCMYQRTITLAL
jgi:hypothetical protein